MLRSDISSSDDFQIQSGQLLLSVSEVEKKKNTCSLNDIFTQVESQKSYYLCLTPGDDKLVNNFVFIKRESHFRYATIFPTLLTALKNLLAIVDFFYSSTN